MSALAKPQLSDFALDTAEGLACDGQKRLSSRFFYDTLGSALFEAITMLPEYGLTRADERLLRRHSPEIASLVGKVGTVVELGSGSGRKTAHILRAFQKRTIYRPIDVSAASLQHCERSLTEFAEVKPIQANWLEGLREAARLRAPGPMFVLFLGSSAGNLDRRELSDFFAAVRKLLRAGDFFLLGADLVKDPNTMLAAYDDSIGVTAAFNRNLLSRANRELQANFDLRAFDHQVRWDAAERRIEMHLASRRPQRVFIDALGLAFHFQEGETIWTESSHKFTEIDLNDYAIASGFSVAKTWIDNEWPFAEALWRLPKPR